MAPVKRNVKLPENPITLSVQQIDELNRNLTRMRHDIKGHLTVVGLAAELISTKPEAAKEHIRTLLEQPPKFELALQTFTAAFEQALGITRF